MNLCYNPCFALKFCGDWPIRLASSAALMPILTHKTFICSVVVIFHLRILAFINLLIDIVNYLVDVFNIRKSFFLSVIKQKGLPIVLIEKPIHTIIGYILHQKQQDSLPAQLFLLSGIPHGYTLYHQTKKPWL